MAERYLLYERIAWDPLAELDWTFFGLEPPNARHRQGGRPPQQPIQALEAGRS